MASSSAVRDYVYELISIFPGFLQTPARWAADRVFSVWNEIYTVMVMFPDSFKFFRQRFHQLVLDLVDLCNQTASTLRWLVTLFVPRWARWALDVAVGWARDEVARVRAILTGLVNTLRTWAQNAVNTLDRFVHNLQNWVVSRLQELWGTLNTVKARVFALLLSPSAFVDWVFAALWARFWRFVNEHGEAIVASWWARRNTLTAQTLARLEAFLVRIL